MRLRFTIRDLLWLTVVAALVMGWSIDHIRHEHFARENITHRNNIEMLEKALVEQKKRNQEMFEGYEATILRLEGPPKRPFFPPDKTP
jgi:hypothetical protein